jgi:hypothetical protein
MNRLLVATSCAAVAGAAATGAYIGVVTGRLTVDLGLGRRTRPLGPLQVDIAAPRETVFAAAAAPYADRQPRAMREKVEILERAGQMVLAAHRTVVGSGLTAVTVETVTLDPPSRMGFRLLRGPVPHVIEAFAFDETIDGTRLSYTGELGTDLWRLGQAWGDLVARSWVHAVRDSMAAIKTESERAPASGALGRHSPDSVGRCAHRILKPGGRFPRGAFSRSASSQRRNVCDPA